MNLPGASSQSTHVMYRVVQKKGTVLLSTSLAWPAVAGCSGAETFSQLSSISFAQPCTCIREQGSAAFKRSVAFVIEDGNPI